VLADIGGVANDSSTLRVTLQRNASNRGGVCTMARWSVSDAGGLRQCVWRVRDRPIEGKEEGLRLTNLSTRYALGRASPMAITTRPAGATRGGIRNG